MWDSRSAYVDNHDGDTVTYLSDLGRSVRHEAAHRLAGVFAPELSQPGGSETREMVRQWHADRTQGHRWPFLVTTRLVRAGDPDLSHENKTLDRFVSDVICMATGEPLNAAVIAFVAARGYGGGIGAS